MYIYKPAQSLKYISATSSYVIPIPALCQINPSNILVRVEKSLF